MAGFADEISKFNPYISQVPTDEYVNAGMLEQSRYDAGVERSQQMIDSVAGADVAGDANTQYLRQKVAQLQSKTSQIVGSDFAKNSVTNQVGQLVGSIYRDPVIQAGMASAVRLQKYQSSWDQLRKDHPDQFNPGDKEYYDQFVGDYMKQSQTKAGLVYNGPTEAFAHKDYYDKIDKKLKEVDPSIQTSISPAGEFMYKIDKSSTVSKDQIDGVISGEINADPDIQRQMQIDAWHSYRSFDGQQMFDHVNDSFNAMLDNYKRNSDYYRDVIKTNPNDHETITAAQKKLVDFDTESQNLRNNRDTYLKALNEGRLDQVKQSVFNDSFRQGLILKYERNNITTDLKNNENSIQAWKNRFEQEHLGIEQDRNNIEKLSYQLRLQEWQAKVKKEGLPEQTVSIPGAVGKDYTEDQNNATITSLQSDVNGTLAKLRSYHTDMNDQQWQQYQKIQEGKYAGGDPSIDPKFAQYKSLTQASRALIDSYTSVGSSIYSDANKQFNVDTLIPAKVNIEGRAYDRETIKSAMDVQSKAYDIAFGKNGELKPTGDQIEYAYQQALGSHTGKPEAATLLALAKSNHLMQFAGPVNNLLQQRQIAIAERFKQFGRTTSYNAQPLAGKPEEIAYYNRVLSTSLQAGQGEAEGGKPTSFENLEAQNVYNDDQGKLHIQYMDKKDSKVYSVTVPTKENKLGNPDPYLQIARAIDVSPTQSTPMDANKALSTVNGRLKYVIQKDAMSGNYELRVWNKGALYNMPSFSTDGNSYTAPNIGSFVERVEQMSKWPDATLDNAIKSLSLNH